MRRPKIPPQQYARNRALTEAIKNQLGDRQPMPDNDLVTMFQTGLVREILDQVKAERVRQIEQEGFTPAHDDEHLHGEIALAAACFALVSTNCPDGPLIHETIWPWEKKWWKPKGRRSNLVCAAALLVAEIERLDRIELAAKADGRPDDWMTEGP